MAAIIIDTIARVLVLVIIVDVILSYFMSPYHPVRETLDKIVEPMLKPIRRIVPPFQMIDFSPLILIVLIQLIRGILVTFV